MMLPRFAHARSVLLAAMLLLIPGSAFGLPDAPTQGVVDVQRAVSECAAGRQARAELRAQFERNQAELDERQAHIRQLREEEREASGPERDRLRRQIAEEVVELREVFRQFRQELEEAETQQVRRIVARIESHAEAVRRDRGLSEVVLLESGQAPPPNATDVTDEVIRRTDAETG